MNKMSCLNMAPKRWKSGQEEIQRINLKTLLTLVDVEFVNCITLKLLEELEDNKKKCHLLIQYLPRLTGSPVAEHFIITL